MIRRILWWLAIPVLALAQPVQLLVFTVVDPTGVACSSQSPLRYYTATNSVFGCSSGAYATLGADSPTFTTKITVPLVVGGTTTTSPLALRSTAGVGTTGADIVFQVGNNGATEAARVLNNGGVLVNTTVDLGAKLTVLDTVSTSPRGILSWQTSTDTNGARVGFAKARGTAGSPTVVVTGDTIGRLMFRGYDGANYLEMGSIEFGVSGTVAATRVPTFIALSTATDAAPSVLTERLRIDNAGKVGIGTASPAQLLTVGSGAGGNGVTQSGIFLGFSNSSNNNAFLILNSSNYGAIQSVSSSNSGTFGFGYATSVNATGAGTTAVWTAAGHFGIGTTSPTYALDVGKTVGTGTARFYDQTATTGSTLVTVTPGAGQTAASTVLSLGGVAQFAGTNTTAAVAGIIGATCPAVTCTAAYTWIQAVSSDGSTVYFPVWK